VFRYAFPAEVTLAGWTLDGRFAQGMIQAALVDEIHFFHRP
jgi:hypothetical protein